MDTEIEYALQNCGNSMSDNLIELTEKLWFTCMTATERGPFSIDSKVDRLVKAAYQRIKQLEYVNKTKDTIECKCKKCGHITKVTCKE